MFIVHKFVSKPQSKRLETSKFNTPKSTGPDQGVQNVQDTPLPDQAEAPSVLTPFVSSSQDTSIALKAAAARLASAAEPDGAIVHTVAVSECCFKIGRITVPPALVIAVNGLSTPPLDSGSSLTEYSKANPPPHWAKVKAIASAPFGGSMKKLTELFTGGWRDVPESERWWDSALTGTVEQKRKTRLEVVESLRSRMEETGALILM